VKEVIITLCMIVRDEEEFIEQCLDSAFTLVDNAVIVDTGSKDNTMKKIKKLGHKVELRSFQWNNDFSEARNFSVQKVKSDWILVLDADEVLNCNPKAIRNTLEDTQFDGFNLYLENIMDAEVSYSSFAYGRLYRNTGYSYVRAIHEHIQISKDKLMDLNTDLCRVFHYGYSEKVMKKKGKAKRNFKILKKELENKPNDPFVYYHMGATLGAMEDYETALGYFWKCYNLSKNIGFGKYHNTMFKRMAQCMFELKEYEEGISFVSELLNQTSFKGFTELHYQLGMFYYETKSYEDALECFMSCIKLGENTEFPCVRGRGSYLAKLMQAKILGEVGNVNRAVPAYVEAVLHPENRNRIGAEAFIEYLEKNELTEVLKELKVLLEG